MALMTPTLILFAVALAIAGAAEHKAKQYLKTHNQRKHTAK
jgi:hypothetical protein